jgi:hypothetical protein
VGRAFGEDRKSIDDDDMTTGNVLAKVIVELSVKCCSNICQEEFDRAKNTGRHKEMNGICG